MAPEILTKDFKERALKNRDCFVACEYSTAERWITKQGYNFTVPKLCDKDTFDGILVEIERRR
jgi:hypothetical protein